MSCVFHIKISMYRRTNRRNDAFFTEIPKKWPFLITKTSILLYQFFLNVFLSDFQVQMVKVDLIQAFYYHSHEV